MTRILTKIALLITAFLSHLDNLLVAQSTTVQVSGVLEDSTFDVRESAGGGATLIQGTSVTSRSSKVRLRNSPFQRESSWGGVVYANSVGSSDHFDNRGQISQSFSRPYVLGSGVSSMAAGSISFVSGNLVPGGVAGECRFRCVDALGCDWALPSTFLSESLWQGRISASGEVQFTPPTSGFAVYPPVYLPYRGELVVQIRYGCDGIADAGANANANANRQMDLDVLGNPWVNYGPNGAYRDGKYAVRVRAQGVAKTQPLGTSWPTRASINTSTVYIDQPNGVSSTQTITWGNAAGNLVPPGGRSIVNTWRTTTIRIPVELKEVTRFEIRSLSHASHHSSRQTFGVIRFPALTTEAPLNPGIGNGVEIRVRLENVQPM